MAGLSLRDRDGAWSGIATPELRWFRYLAKMPFLGISNCEEGLYIPSGLGTPEDPPRGAGECRWGEGCLGLTDLLPP